MRFPKFLRWAQTPARRIAAKMIDRGKADAALGHYRDAAFLYEEALRLAPGQAKVHVQCGHMWKETGAFGDAERHYAAADRLRPGDADLALQFGHLYKLAGRIADAERAYRRAAALRPDWSAPAAELAHFAASGWQGSPEIAKVPDTQESGVEITAMQRAVLSDGLVSDLAPRPDRHMPRDYPSHVEVRRLGRIEPGYWGDSRTLRGVEAIRGHCVSSELIVEMQIIMGGLTLFRGPVKGGYPLPQQVEADVRRKYVFNIWYDFSRFVSGRYAIELRLIDVAGGTRSHHDRIVIAEPRPEASDPDCDALITLSPNNTRSIEEQIAARPSVIHRAERRLFAKPPRAILVQRADQLGDMVASIPAVIRLRGLFPGARIVGLLTAANAAFAATLSLFDEIIVIDFPDDPLERRRVMPLDEQAALQARLRPYAFDLAIDLATSGVSRPLLRLSGAPFLLGVGDAAWPWLSAGFDFNTHDPVTRLDVIPHSAKVLAMVEALGAVLHSSARVMRRNDLSRRALVPLGIMEDERYIVLHAGARIGFSHWPHYPALARMILDSTDYRVVMLTEDATLRATLPADLIGSDRFVLLDRRLPFDDLDALLSFCTVLVGNDSGPKHLASLRGTTVVTLFTNRISYAEWGQELGGVIMTRKVPCAGCQILHDADECGKDFACIVDIRPDEVFDVVREYL